MNIGGGLMSASLFRCLVLLLATAWIATPSAFAQAELKLGRYVGHVKLDGARERIALTVDTYIDQPDDRTQFPKLNAIFRLQLGGYGGGEYVTEIFEDIRYDFSNGQLSLDEPNNDMVIVAEVRESGGTTVTGQVWVRSASASGTLFLQHLSDEPGEPGDDDDDGPGGGGGPGGEQPGDDAPFMASLSGRYEGMCGLKRYAMQISTGKGLAAQGPADRGLHGYGIVAMLAEGDSEICNGTWCVVRNFSAGQYNFFSGKLLLDEPAGSSECRLEAGRLTCRVRFLDETVSCDLRRTESTTQAFVKATRLHQVQPTSAQRLELPAPLPPRSTELINALRGTFSGWLHNETLDRYQPFRLNVMPSVSSDNPHNENEVVITATGVQHFGRETRAEGWPQQFDRRSFYLSAGFNLESPNSDGFLQIEAWRQGFVSGVWYSHAFGRVGTVQLVKGDLPPLDPSAKVLAPIAGTYQGPSVGSADVRWWFEALLPTQPVARDESTLTFEGAMNLTGGTGVRVKIARGSYDAATATVAWLTEERDRPRMISGQVDADGRLMLLWPGAPIWGVPLPANRFVYFQRAP